MKIVGLDAIPVSVPYRLRETSAVIDRGGVSDVIVKLVRGSPSGSRRQQSVRRDQRAPGRRHERGEPFEQFQQLQQERRSWKSQTLIVNRDPRRSIASCRTSTVHRAGASSAPTPVVPRAR
jgi:hypothetical protein